MLLIGPKMSLYHEIGGRGSEKTSLEIVRIGLRG